MSHPRRSLARLIPAFAVALLFVWCPPVHAQVSDTGRAGVPTGSKARKVCFEVAPLLMLDPTLYEVPLDGWGIRTALGARITTSRHFSFAPQLVVEHYRADTPQQLQFTSTNIAVAMDVAIVLPWLHWELFLGRGQNSLERVTTDGEMSYWGDVVGISVGPEYRFGERQSVFLMVGHRWLEDAETTVLGAGFRM